MKCWRNGISSKMTQCLLGWRLTLAKLWLFEHASQLQNIPVKCHSVSTLHNTKILNSTFILMWYLPRRNTVECSICDWIYSAGVSNILPHWWCW
jgi:hypothetical protein